MLTLFYSLGAMAGELTPQERAGREIYRAGESPSDRAIEARVGNQQIRLSAASFPCASCHGEDGRGREESGVVPSDIRWSRLSRDYGGQSPSGRRFPAYDETTLARAIREGVDSGGQALDPAMPRFELDEADMAALIAYLKRLEADRDPGITAERLTLATVIPASGPLAPQGEAVVALLEARLAELNAEGGLYGRELVLEVLRADGPEAARARFEQVMAGESAFALLSPFTAGMDEAVAELAETHGVPVVAPVTRRPPADAGARAYSFYLFGGPELQARALVDFAFSGPARAASLVVVHQGEAVRSLAEAAAAQARRRSVSRGAEVTAMAADAGNVDALAQAQVEAVVFLGDGEALTQWLTQADAAGWHPRVYALGGLVGRAALEAPAAFQGRLHLAFPSSAADAEADAREAFAAFHRRHGLPRAGLAEQAAAYAATELLVTGLRKAGRELSRERLVAAFDDLYAYRTGLTRPLTFTGSRRIGVRGAHVVAVDLEAHRLAGSTWVEPR